MTRDPSCVFCKIVAAEIPGSIVFQDDAVLAFLDIAPLAEGHLLVVPKQHCRGLTDLPPSVAARLAATLPRLGQALLEITHTTGFNLLLNQGSVAGQVVEHAHFHLIPRTEGDQRGYRWKPGSYAPGRAAEVTAQFRAALGAAPAC